MKFINEINRTALSIATEKENIDIVKLLIERPEINANITNKIYNENNLMTFKIIKFNYILSYLF